MRLPLRLSGATLLVLLALPTPGRAQFGIPNDPFYLYYGYVLPQQNQQELQRLNAAQQRVNANIATQERAQAERAEFLERALSDLSQPLDSQGRRRVSVRIDNSAITRGTGPAGYFNNTGRHFPARTLSRSYARRR
jgi:hypothetical protein